MWRISNNVAISSVIAVICASVSRINGVTYVCQWRIIIINTANLRQRNRHVAMTVAMAMARRLWQQYGGVA